jgi:hypothetical protein
MTDTDKTATTPDAPAAAPAEAKPPWGEDFDPERAWSTITAQREAEKQLRAELAKFQKAQKEAEDASKSDTERLAEQVASRESELGATRRELWSLRAIAKHNIPADLAEFLTGDSEEAVMERAKRLAEKIKSTAPAAPSSRPTPRLAPGDNADDASAGFDAAAVVEAARKSFTF